MAVALSAVDAESGLDPLRHSLKHKGVLIGNVHISGAWLCDWRKLSFSLFCLCNNTASYSTERCKSSPCLHAME